MVDCPLCYAPFGSGGIDSEAHVFRGCGHVFCRGCIAQLRQLGCPACRWKPAGAYASNLSNLTRGVVLKLFIDFSEANTMQTKLEDTEKKLAAAQLEMEQFKEKTRIEAARSKRKWKDEADSLRAELEQANKDVEYLTRRLEDEKLRSAKDTAALVSDAVKTTLEQYMHPIPSSNSKVPKPPHIPTVSARVDERIARTVPSQQSLNSTKAKAQAPTTTVPAKAQLPSNKSQVEAKQSSGSAKPKVSELPSAQRPSSDSRHIQPPRSPSPNGMDWTPTEVVFEPSRPRTQRPNAP